MKYTIQDIARETNLSRNTVSKALRGADGVSLETRKLVQEKAREMQYRKFIIENTPVENSKSHGSVLFLTRASVNYSDFWINVMRGIESVLGENGYDLVLGVMNEDDLSKLHFPTSLVEKSVCGVIIVEICDIKACNAIINFGLPVVFVDMPNQFDRFIGRSDIITMENQINIEYIVEQLIQKGHKRFAFAGDISSMNAGRGYRERYEALCRTLNRHDLILDEEHSFLHETEENFAEYPYLINQFKGMSSLPDVYICGNDWTALHVMRAVQSLNYEVPKDICFVGFDNIHDSSKSFPTLTTIDTPKEYLGIQAARCILNRIADPHIPYVYSEYTTKLILRGSTDL